MGISTVFQEVNLCPNLTVAENIFIGRQPMKRGQIDWKSINRRAAELMRGMGMAVDVTLPLSYYSIAIQQMVSIARAVDIKARVLILDEPTSSLDEHEVQRLFAVMRDLKAQGLGIIFITHFLDQVFEISDRITVLRNGRLVGNYDAAKITKLDLVTQMIGKDMNQIFNLKRAEQKPGAPVMLEPSTSAFPARWRTSPFRSSRRIGGLCGASGLRPHGDGGDALWRHPSARGTSRMRGKALTPSRRWTPSTTGWPSVRRPETGRHHRRPFGPREHLPGGAGQARLFEAHVPAGAAGAGGQVHQASVHRHAGRGEKSGRIVGGNQQKVILARWMATEPDVLILDEPTRASTWVRRRKSNG
jgi:simple sugar transport system ATP-binding protein